MTRITVKTGGLRRMLYVDKIEGREDQWQCYMHGYLPETFTCDGIGSSIVVAIGKAMEFSRDPNQPRSNRGRKTGSTVAADGSVVKPSNQASVPQQPDHKAAKTPGKSTT